MNIFKNTFKKGSKKGDQTPVVQQQVTRETDYIDAIHLGRSVRIDCYLPPGFKQNSQQPHRLLLFNDGQDMEAVGLLPVLSNLYAENFIYPVIIVGIHATGQRINEYGTACMPDYKGRGAKAIANTRFVLRELMPYLRSKFVLYDTPAMTGFAGFSLGGLSAFDIGWANPDIFGTIGVFSGALWWRYQPYTDDNPDGHRIMHEVVKSAPVNPGMRFWFEAGTLDEECDRNNNGVIDAIDDTIDLITLLEKKGYEMDKDICYVEVEGGRHDQVTWGQVLPDFLIWAFGK
jgi:enterochelin esterase-like enzyme